MDPSPHRSSRPRRAPVSERIFQAGPHRRRFEEFQSSRRNRAVGLFQRGVVYSSNVRVTPSPAAPIENGSDAAGTWDVRFSSDAGHSDGAIKLARDGNKLSGTWTGALGDNRPDQRHVARLGFVRLSFDGEWPKDSQDGAPGPVTVFLEGWIDDASASGRMRVAGRADGPWTAQRQAQ